jgi:hypothetical protein
VQNEATKANKADDRAYLDEPAQPLLQGKVPQLSESRHVNNVRFFPPVFPINGQPHQTQILAIGVSPTPEEAASVLSTQHAEHYQKPRLLKGPLGQILKDVIDRFSELQSDRMTYATAIPWLLPKARRFRPNKDELEWTKPYLLELVKYTKPTVILAFGKLVFDQLVDLKISADDARGGWFDCNGIPVYLMDPAHQMVTQPWTLSTVMDDFKEVARMVSIRNGTNIPEEPVRSEEIRTLEQLKELVTKWEKFNYSLFACDNEWKGANFVDGQLRSTQFAWTDFDGAYLNYFNEHGEPILGRTQNLTGAPLWNINQWIEPDAFYVDYAAVGAILQPWLNRPETRYIGHYFSADSTWLEKWLGLKMHGRCLCDTAFALQTTNEYAPQGLERLALQVTNFGRYDIPLVMCKKELKITKGEGYGRIPDSVLVPYGVLDVIVPFRAWPYLEAELKRQGTLTYFHNIVMPLVSDTFHTFALTGLPVDRELFEATRSFMNWAYRELLKDFLESMAEQADQMMSQATGVPKPVLKHMRELNAIGARNWLISQAPLVESSHDPKMLDIGLPVEPKAEFTQALLDHWENVGNFNIRSGPVMTRWLFDVMHLTPVKSTGKPSMMWEKVQTLPLTAQKNMKPAADKETIEILAEIDTSGLLPKLLNLSNVGNICKGFLKEGSIDQDGEVVKENGLAQYIASDGSIHCLWSLTETSRPRTFLPNVLNLSKYLNKYIFRGLMILLDKVEIPQEFEVLFGSAEDREGVSLKDLIKERVPSVRSVIKAPDGWCLIESDWRTAEIRGQGFISGDAALIELMVGKDKSFALYKGKPVRLFFQADTKIYPENQDQNLLMAWCEEGKDPIPLKPSDLDRDENGELLHPSYDLHWSLAEDLTGKPREVLNSDIDRGRGKTGNFCIAENELVLTKERGWIPIQDIMCCDTLWDGVEWVSHEGVIISGYKEVVYYQGLWATERHKVWTEERGRTTLGVAKSSSLTLERVAEAFGPDPYSWSGDPARYPVSHGEMYLGGEDQVPHLQRGEMEKRGEPLPRAVYEMSVSASGYLVGSLSWEGRQGSEITGGPVSGNAATLRKGHPRVLSSLQRAGNQVSVQGPLRVRGLGAEGVARGGFSEKGLRPPGQRRTLLSWKSASCNQGGEPSKQEAHPGYQYRHGSRFLEEAPLGKIHGGYGPWVASFWSENTGNTSEEQGKYARRTQEKRLVLTYDILNAGPRNRFACSGVIVSNSGAYLITPGTLERRLEASTGIKPPEGTGQAILDSLEARQPVSVQYIRDVSQYPKNGTLLQAQSGRIRHFPVHSAEIRDMPWRVAQGILRAMGNEAANFLYQESVAATLARACKWLNDFFLKHGMKARCNMGLYDSCVTLCPLEERWVVDAAHTLFMDRINVWCYHRRYMSYPIDTDFVYRWSWKPTKAQKAELYDKSFHPMEPEREKDLLAKLANIEKNFFDAQPWILQRLNVV